MSDFEDKLQSILANPDAMNQIMSIAQSISGSASNNQSDTDILQPEDDPPVDYRSSTSAFDSLDPRLLQLGMTLLSEYNRQDDDKVALLTALHPFIKENRYAKLDQAIQIAKLARVIRVALNSFRSGGTEYV